MSIEKQNESDHVYDDGGWLESDAEAAPGVIGGAPGEKTMDLGDVAFVPAEVEMSPDDEDATVKLVSTPDGELVALAYTSLEELVRCCGDRHPWVAFQANKIAVLSGVTGVDVLLWNQELSPELRRDGGAYLEDDAD